MIPKYKLNNGVEIPAIGLGTYLLEGNILTEAIKMSVDTGSGLIDTASAYGNEEAVGKSLRELKKQGYNRNQFFIETKVGDKIDENGRPIGYYFYNNPSTCPCRDTRKVVYEQIENSLNLLGVEYLDLVMIHWPYYEVLNEIWTSLEELYDQKIVRAIGVSNCRKRHLERIMKTAHYCPMINQIYISPINTRSEDMIFCNEHNIIIEAYGPFFALRNNEFKSHKEIYALEEKYQKNISQILLRWYYQKRIIPIPKSHNPERIIANNDIFDFEITSADISTIDNANINFQYLVESQFCPGF